MSSVEPKREKPHRFEGIGSDPDARFSLANERTFLAWVRTALALIVTGLGATHLSATIGLGSAGVLVGVMLASIGILAALWAPARWERYERAIRLGRGIPVSRAPFLLSYGLVLAAAVGFALLLIVRPR